MSTLGLSPYAPEHPRPEYLTFDERPQWFAAYTGARHEKTVSRHLAVRDIESFLPLYRARHTWKNGSKVDLELPLFPSYIFVRFCSRQRAGVLAVPGLISLVGVDRPIPVPEPDIEALRSGIHLAQCEPHPYLVVGERARIKTGALAGMEGVLVRKKGSYRVVLSLDLIMRSVAVEVDCHEIEPIGSSALHRHSS